MNFSCCHENLCTVHCCIYWCHFCKFNIYLYDLSSISSTLVQIRPLFVCILLLPLGPRAVCVNYVKCLHKSQ